MTQFPPPPPAATPKRSNRTLLTILIALVAVLVLAGSAAGSYVLGANSRDGEVKTAEDTTAETQATLDEVEAELADVQDALDEAEAEIAACDTESAQQIFDDLMAAHYEVLEQYSEYLDNDELIFLIHWPSVNRAGNGQDYNGRDTYDDQFSAAMSSCGDGEGNSA